MRYSPITLLKHQRFKISTFTSDRFSDLVNGQYSSERPKHSGFKCQRWLPIDSTLQIRVNVYGIPTENPWLGARSCPGSRAVLSAHRVLKQLHQLPGLLLGDLEVNCLTGSIMPRFDGHNAKIPYDDCQRLSKSKSQEDSLDDQPGYQDASDTRVGSRHRHTNIL